MRRGFLLTPTQPAPVPQLIRNLENDARENSFIALPSELIWEVLRFCAARNDKVPTRHPCDWKTLNALARVSKTAYQFVASMLVDINARFHVDFPYLPASSRHFPMLAQFTDLSEDELAAIADLRGKKCTKHVIPLPADANERPKHWRLYSDGRCMLYTGTFFISDWYTETKRMLRIAGEADSVVHSPGGPTLETLFRERYNVAWCTQRDRDVAFLTASGMLCFISPYTNDSQSTPNVRIWPVPFRGRPYRVMLHACGGIVWSKYTEVVKKGSRYNHPDILTYHTEVYMWNRIETADLSDWRVSSLIYLNGLEREGVDDVIEDPLNAAYEGDDPAQNHFIIFMCMIPGSSERKKIKVSQAQLASVALHVSFTEEELANMARLAGITE